MRCLKELDNLQDKKMIKNILKRIYKYVILNRSEKSQWIFRAFLR